MKIIFRNNIIKSLENKTILESIEIFGLKPFSMCKEGYCATCKLTIESGEVEYINEPLAMLEEKEILPCICIPKTDIIIKG